MDESLDKKTVHTIACDKICRPKYVGKLESRKSKILMPLLS